ncbi:hypothetical protein [Cytobacillus sp.]|uniref:hypothetical protein n=1 Tax=Cytobacillus sp. TaxID=2675269 RepID=UPI0028BDF63A|nr:hypothetical protein [Cytobacillus sp.]
MSKNWRKSIAIFLTVLLGFVIFYAGTDGFRAFTAESARTYKLLQAFYLVDRKGYLAEVMDFTKIDEAANTVITTLKNDTGE